MAALSNSVGLLGSEAGIGARDYAALEILKELIRLHEDPKVVQQTGQPSAATITAVVARSFVWADAFCAASGQLPV